MQICTKCKQNLDFSMFYKNKRYKTGFTHRCKTCISNTNKEKYKSDNGKTSSIRCKKYRLENAEKVKESRKLFRLNNKEKLFLQKRKYRQKNKEKIRIKNLEYKRKNKNKLNKRNKERMSNDKIFSLNTVIRNSINKSIKDKNNRSWTTLVNFTIEDLVIHLESKFKDGMTWENRGKNGWHIDHIIPQSLFKFDSYNHPAFKACWALSNLQPMWAKDNLLKGNKIIITKEIQSLLDSVNL